MNLYWWFDEDFITEVVIYTTLAASLATLGTLLYLCSYPHN